MNILHIEDWQYSHNDNDCFLSPEKDMAPKKL